MFSIDGYTGITEDVSNDSSRIASDVMDIEIDEDYRDDRGNISSRVEELGSKLDTATEALDQCQNYASSLEELTCEMQDMIQQLLDEEDPDVREEILQDGIHGHPMALSTKIAPSKVFAPNRYNVLDYVMSGISVRMDNNHHYDVLSLNGVKASYIASPEGVKCQTVRIDEFQTIYRIAYLEVGSKLYRYKDYFVDPCDPSSEELALFKIETGYPMVQEVFEERLLSGEPYARNV